VTRPTILDAAMGTELARRGAAIDGPRGAARALDEAPGLVTAIHRAHVEAGARVLTTNTLCAAVEPDGLARRMTLAVTLARDAAEAGGSGVRVAGSIGPLAHALADPDVRAARYREAARALADAGCDVVLLETMVDTSEILRAIDAVRDVTTCPLWVATVAGPGATLLDGSTLADLAAALPLRELDAWLCGCTDPAVLAPAVAAMAAHAPAGLARGAVPNLGPPHGARDPTHLAATLAELAVTHGLRIVGGCCGTTPAFTRALVDALG
jgi:methionine synthase I (cobalamin-dependent)